MRLSELQSKDVVSIRDGKKIGSIADATLDSNGTLLSLTILKGKFAISKKDELKIEWRQIKKIGEDVILVDMDIKS